MKFQLTPDERRWVLYDVGNSAFTLLIATIMPIYFNYLASLGGVSDTEYLAYWGYAASLSTLIVALVGPFVGTLSDKRGMKKRLFTVVLLLGAVGCVVLGFAVQWLVFIVLFVLVKSLYSVSLIIYDSMLSDVTTDERMDQVSSLGYAWGYIGSCIPFVLCLLLVLKADLLGLTMQRAMTVAFAITALWWVGVTIPLLRHYQQTHYTREKISTFHTLSGIISTLKDIAQNKVVLFFLLSFFFYIDGVYTIIEMATAYGSALGLDTTGLLLALLVTQLVAFPSSIVIGRLSGKISSNTLISVCILAYFGIAMIAVFMTSQLHFWILAVCVGLFQGGIQALSRSHFSKIIPPEKSGAFFGIYDICGKGASFTGTLVISAVTQITGSASLGVLAISLFFLIGLWLFRVSVKHRAA